MQARFRSYHLGLLTNIVVFKQLCTMHTYIDKDGIDVVTARVLPFQEHTVILNCAVGKGSFTYNQVKVV